MRVALVHDYLNQYGGAERVLEVFCRIFPKAPIYTLIYDKKRTGFAFEGKKIYTSFLQKAPFLKSHHRPFLMLMPLAIEQFDFSQYDLVISDSSSYAKGVITGPGTAHFCYCHTPTRYIWDNSHKYIEEFGYSQFVRKLAPFFLNYIRLWDEQAADRVDQFIGNSYLVAERIKKYYNREARVIYPPIKTNLFNLASQIDKYFLMVGRFLSYKRFDLAIEVFNQLGWPLKIVGDGPQRKKLKKQAKDNIEFVGLVSDEKLKKYYAHCRALIFPQEEDSGIAAVEAMASGRPVIAYRSGGALETVKEGITGLFFDEQKPESMIEILKGFNRLDFDSRVIRQHALRFDEEVFMFKIRDFIKKNLNFLNSNLNKY